MHFLMIVCISKYVSASSYLTGIPVSHGFKKLRCRMCKSQIHLNQWLKILFILVFTITRFFEAKIEYYPEEENSTVTRPFIEPTSMRTAPIYTTYSNWSRVIVLGIIPFVALVYLNFKIYQVCYFWYRYFSEFSNEIDYYA